MKRYCKNIRLDKDWIMACMLECFSDKWKRRDVAGFLAGYQTGQPLSVRAVSRLIQEKRSNVDPLLERAAEDLAREIKERDVHFPEIHYSMRYDGNSGKLREIGVESIKQQIYNYVAVKIINEDYSPDAIIGELTALGRWSEFQTQICTTTVYSYIDKGIFLRVTNKNLPVKKNRKRKYNKVKKQKRAEAGESIENRPEIINSREEFGHWEMDSVLGRRGKSKNTLLTLTERKTRAEIIFKLNNHSAEEVVAAVDRLEKRWGELFKTVFKSITVDNGTEFAYCEELERSAIGAGKRTKMYYCHPYSSWERGTNEVTNKMVRRKVPKGTNFDDRTAEDIQEVENWINKYPRRIHGYKSAAEMFEEELQRIS